MKQKAILWKNKKWKSTSRKTDLWKDWKRENTNHEYQDWNKEVTTDPVAVQRILKESYTLYTHKSPNVDVTDQFLETTDYQNPTKMKYIIWKLL